jgi:[ribosomal protein S18]-alanine N-acetyltransferase
MSDELDQIMAIMDRAFDPRWGEAWTRAQLADSLVFPHTHYTLIAADGSRPGGDRPAVGFTLVRAAPGEEELLLIAVDPAHRGRGLGARLLEQFAQDARDRGAERVFLEMRSNNPAERLYRALGFEPIGTRPNYYLQPDGGRLDATTFGKSL